MQGPRRHPARIGMVHQHFMLIRSYVGETWSWVASRCAGGLL